MDWGAGSERPLSYRLGEDGEPEPMDMNDPLRWEHGDPFRDPRRQVARNEIDGYLVSTVFLVIDHSFDGGDPVLWETMIFKGGESDLYCERYTSREAAAQGHARVVAALLSGKKPEEIGDER